MSDVVVVGGGVIGLSIAYELAGQGASVTVLDQSQFGQEASWAGAGILPPGNLQGAQTAEGRLRGLSHSLWPAWSQQLREETGIDNGFRNCGGLQLSLSDDDLQRDLAAWKHEGVTAERLTPDEAFLFEPALTPDARAAVRLPELSQVRNPRHLKALIKACQLRGVQLVPGTPVVDWETASDRVLAARSIMGRHTGVQFIISAGAWSRHLLERADVRNDIVPVRGQMVLLNVQPTPFRHVLELGSRYLVPRPDGRILVGSTEEHVGFEKRNTAEAVRGLIELAETIVPSLRSATVERFWSGLRPCAPGGLPVLDRVADLGNLYVAAGHFRAGLQMSPGTAVLVRQMLLGQKLEFSLVSYSLSARADGTAQQFAAQTA